MNRIYKLIFNKRTAELEVASELATNAAVQTKSVPLTAAEIDTSEVSTASDLPTARLSSTQYKFKNFMPSVSHHSYRHYAKSQKSTDISQSDHLTNHALPSALATALTKVTPSNLSQTLGSVGTTLALAGTVVAGLEATSIASAQANTVYGSAGSVGSVVSGTATAVTHGLVTTIKNSPNAIINWQSFNINKNEILKFVQQTQDSAVLNRVVGSQVSKILGSLSSNGHVFIINPNGIIFGKNARVNVGGLVASTLDINNKDFLHGRYVFNQQKDHQIAQVLNQGMISVSDSGEIALIGGQAVNNGILKTVKGTVYLLAGNSIEIADLNNPQISYKVSAKNKAVNLNTIIARNVALAGNKVLNGPSSASEFADIVGANNGKVHAKISATGEVVLFGGSEANQLQTTNQAAKQVIGKRTGLVINNGVINVSNRHGKAGSVKILGDYVVLDQHSAIYAEGLGMSTTSKTTAKTTTKHVTASKPVNSTTKSALNPTANVIDASSSSSVQSTSATPVAKTGSIASLTTSSDDATNDALVALDDLSTSPVPSDSNIKVSTTTNNFVSGGDVLVGGDAAGAGKLKLAKVTVLDPEQKVFVGTTGEHNLGSAGHFVSWGEVSIVDGLIDASATAGAGGFIETSAKRIQISPNLSVNVNSKAAQAGTWLLDPYEFYVIGKEWADANNDAFEKYRTEHHILGNQGSFETSWGLRSIHKVYSSYVKLNKPYTAPYINSFAYDVDLMRNIMRNDPKKPARIEIKANSVVFYSVQMDMGRNGVSIYANITDTKPDASHRRGFIYDESTTGGNSLNIINSTILLADNSQYNATIGITDYSIGSINITDSRVKGSIHYNPYYRPLETTFTIHNSTLVLNNKVNALTTGEDTDVSFGSSYTAPDSYLGGKDHRHIHYNISDSKIIYDHNVYIGHANDIKIVNTTFTANQTNLNTPDHLFINGVDVSIDKSTFNGGINNQTIQINAVNDLDVSNSTFHVNASASDIDATGVFFGTSSQDYIYQDSKNNMHYQIQIADVNLTSNINITNVTFDNANNNLFNGGVVFNLSYNTHSMSRYHNINLTDSKFNLSSLGIGVDKNDHNETITIKNTKLEHLHNFNNSLHDHSTRQTFNIIGSNLTYSNEDSTQWSFTNAQLNITDSTVKINPDGPRGLTNDQRIHQTLFNARVLKVENSTIVTNNSLTFQSSRHADNTVTQQGHPTRNAHLQIGNSTLTSTHGAITLNAHDDNVSVNNVTYTANEDVDIIAQDALFAHKGTVTAKLGMVNFTAYQKLHLDNYTITTGAGAVIEAVNNSEVNDLHPYGYLNNNLTIANTSFKIKPVLPTDADFNAGDFPTVRSFAGNDFVEHEGYEDVNTFFAPTVLIKSNQVSLSQVSSSGEDDLVILSGDALNINGGVHQVNNRAKLVGINAVHAKALDINATNSITVLNTKTQGNVTLDYVHFNTTNDILNISSTTDLTMVNSSLSSEHDSLTILANNSIKIADTDLKATSIKACLTAGSFVSYNSNYTAVVDPSKPKDSGFISISGVTKQALDSKTVTPTKPTLDHLTYPNLDHAALDPNSDFDYVYGPDVARPEASRMARTSSRQPRAASSAGVVAITPASVDGSGDLGNFGNGGVIGDSDSDETPHLVVSSHPNSGTDDPFSDSSSASYTPDQANNGLVYFAGGKIKAPNGLDVASSYLHASDLNIEAANRTVLLGSSGDIDINRLTLTFSQLNNKQGLLISSTGLTGVNAKTVSSTNVSLNQVVINNPEDTNTTYVGVVGDHLDTVKITDSNLSSTGSLFISPAIHYDFNNATLISRTDQIILGQTNDVQARGYFANHNGKYYLPTPTDGSTGVTLEPVHEGAAPATGSSVQTQDLALVNTTIVSFGQDLANTKKTALTTDEALTDGVRLVALDHIDLTADSNISSSHSLKLYAGDNANNHLKVDRTELHSTLAGIEGSAGVLDLTNTQIQAKTELKLNATHGITLSNDQINANSLTLNAGTGALVLDQETNAQVQDSTKLVASTVKLDHATVHAQGETSNITVVTPNLVADHATLEAGHTVNVTVTNKQPVTVTASKFYGHHELVVNSEDNIGISESTLASDNLVTVHASKDLTVTHSEINATKSSETPSAQASAQLVKLEAGHNLDLNQAKIDSKDLIATSGAILNIEKNSMLTASHDLTAKGLDLTVDSSYLTVGNNLTLDATRDLTLRHSTMASANNITLNAQANLDLDHAILKASNNISAIAKDHITISHNSDVYASGNNLDIKAGKDLAVTDHSSVLAMNNITIKSNNTNVAQYSKIISKNKQVTMASNHNTLVSDHSLVNAKTGTNIGAGHDLIVDNYAKVYSDQDAKTTAANSTIVSHNSQIAGSHGAYVKSGTLTQVSDDSSIVSGGKAIIDSTDTLILSNSTVVSQDDILIKSKHDFTADDSKIGSFENVNIETGHKTTLTNGSSIQGINNVNIDSGETLISQGSKVISSEDVDITSATNSGVLDHSHVQGDHKVNIKSKGDTYIDNASSVLSKNNVTITSGGNTNIQRNSAVGAPKTSISSEHDTIISASKVIGDNLNFHTKDDLSISSHSMLEGKEAISATVGKRVDIDDSTINTGTNIDITSHDDLSVHHSNINADKNIDLVSSNHKIDLDSSKVKSGCKVKVLANQDATVVSSEVTGPCSSSIRSQNGDVSIDHVVVNTHHDQFIDKNDATVTIGSDKGAVDISNSEVNTPNHVEIDSNTGTTIGNTTIDTNQGKDSSITVIGKFNNGGGNNFRSPNIIGAKIDDPHSSVVPPLPPPTPAITPAQPVLQPPSITPILAPPVSKVDPITPYHPDNSFIYDLSPNNAFTGGSNSFISSDGASAPYDGSVLPNIRVVVFVNPLAGQNPADSEKNKNRISPIISSDMQHYDELGLHIYYTDVGLDAGSTIKPSTISVSVDDSDDFDASCKVKVGKILSKHGLAQAQLHDLSSLSSSKLSRSEIQSIAKCMSQTGGSTSTSTPSKRVRTTKAHALEVSASTHTVTTPNPEVTTDLATNELADPTPDTPEPSRYYNDSPNTRVTVDKINNYHLVTHHNITSSHAEELHSKHKVHYTVKANSVRGENEVDADEPSNVDLD